jgi:hypothetical protein
MSFLSHELETWVLKWGLIATSDAELLEATESLAQEIVQFKTSDESLPGLKKTSLFSPSKIDPNSELRHLIGATLGKRGHFNLRLQVLGFDFSTMRTKPDQFSAWAEGWDCLVFYSSEKGNFRDFFYWNTPKLYLNQPHPPVIFWGDGWVSKHPSREPSPDSTPEARFMEKSRNAWITRNFKDPMRFFDQKGAFFKPSLDWILSFS